MSIQGQQARPAQINSRRSLGLGFLTSARAGDEVVTGIQGVPGRHLSGDRVEAQELVALEAVVPFKPPQSRSAISNRWPGAFLFGSCSKVPEPLAVTYDQEIKKHSVRQGSAHLDLP